MAQSYDSIVFWIAILFFLILLLRLLWKSFPFQISWGIEEESDPLSYILRKKGYRLIRKNVRIPIGIHYGEERFNTRFFIDGVAKKDGKWYIVKVGRSKKPLQFTGSWIRDALLPYSLLRKWDGILYVEPEEEKIYRFTFEIDRSYLPGPLNIFPYLLFFATGFLLAFMLK